MEDKTDIIQPDIKQYDINWDKLKTIKDIKKLLKLIATKIVIDHNNTEDIEIYNDLKEYLIDE